MVLLDEGLEEEASLLRMDQMQELVVEREALWGIVKSRVEGGHAINVCQA